MQTITTPTPELENDLSGRTDVSFDDGYDSASSRAQGAASRAAAKAEDLTRRGLERARRAASEVRYRAADLGDATVHRIQDRPLSSVLVAVAFGAAATLLVQWLSHSRQRY